MLSFLLSIFYTTVYILAEILTFLFTHTLFVSVSSLFLCLTSFTFLSIISSFPLCHSPWPLTFFHSQSPQANVGWRLRLSVCTVPESQLRLPNMHRADVALHLWLPVTFVLVVFFLSWCLSELIFMEGGMSAGLSVHMHHISLWQKSWWFQVKIEWSSPPEVVFLFNSLTASFPRLNRQLNYWWNNSEASLFFTLIVMHI